MISSGLWVPVVGSVLRDSRSAPDPWMRAHAGILASGRYRAVSHTTAAALWGWEIDDAVHVIRRGGRTHPGLEEHRLELAGQDYRTLQGIRITTLRRTLTDVLTSLEFRQCVAALAEGFRLRVFRPDEVIGAAAAARGRTGAPRAREVAWTCRGGPYSVPEWDFHQIAWTIDPSGWKFNEPISDDEGLIGYVDALHVPTGVVVEIDGRAFHGDRFQQDRSRDQRMACLGLLCVRLTSQDVGQPTILVGRLHRIMAARSR